MSKLLTSEILTLRPATPQDKHKIFTWLTSSDLTGEMLGLPGFPDCPAPTWEEFDEDYSAHYFDNSQPLSGRCFVLVKDDQEIGQINYNEIDPETRSTEIDIWLSDRQYTGKGFGTAAINILCSYLAATFSCKTFYIAPSLRNKNAIRSYKKAGFMETDALPDGFVPDYHDAILMIKTLD